MRSASASSSIIPAASQYIARQPNCAPINPLTVRASSTPINRPLITVPNHAPALPWSCEAGGQRYDELWHNGRDADRKAGKRQPGDRRCEGGRDQRDGDDKQHSDDQAPSFEGIAKRHNE